MNFKLKPITLALITSLTLQSCATTGVNGERKTIKETLKSTFDSEDPCSNSKRNVGVALGAVGGMLVAAVTGDKSSIGRIVLGGVIGAGLGGLIGNEIDKRQCEISKIQKKYDADVTLTPLGLPIMTDDQNSKSQTSTNPSSSPLSPNNNQNVGLSVSVVDKDGKPQFESNSDELQPEARAMFLEIAQTYSKPEKLFEAKTTREKQDIEKAFNDRRLLLIGHTDDTGSSAHNAALSELRAKKIAKLFKDAGLPEDRVFYQGAGETMPIADNATEEGRAKNRRVEIVDLTNEDVFKMYLQNRPVNTHFYRPAEGKNAQSVAKLDSEAKTNKSKTAELETESTPKKPKNKKSESNEIANNKTSSKDTNSTLAIATKATEPWIDFGGVPASELNDVISIGNQLNSKKLSFLNEAQASDITRISSCNLDRPRKSGEVKALKNNKAYSTSDYLPGVYNSSWAGQANGHLVALTNVAVLRDGGLSPNKPNLLIYKNYKSGTNPKPNFRGSPDVNIYRGDYAMLYRVFSDGPIKCMDVVIPNNNPKEAPGSKIQYIYNSSLYSASFNPKLAK